MSVFQETVEEHAPSAPCPFPAMGSGHACILPQADKRAEAGQSGVWLPRDKRDPGRCMCGEGARASLDALSTALCFKHILTLRPPSMHLQKTTGLLRQDRLTSTGAFSEVARERGLQAFYIIPSPQTWENPWPQAGYGDRYPGRPGHPRSGHRQHQPLIQPARSTGTSGHISRLHHQERRLGRGNNKAVRCVHT